MQGWGLFEWTCEFSGIQFTKHFIEFVLLKTNHLLDSNSNLTLTRQTCYHRSSRVAESKHWALAFDFSVRIWYMFFIPKSRVESDLGLCMISVLAMRMRLCSANFRRILRSNSFWNRKSALCGRIFFASTEIMHRPRSNFPLHIFCLFVCLGLILRTHAKFVCKIKMLALGVCFPQPCSSDGRRFAAQDHVGVTTNHFVRFHKDEFNEMLCKLEFTEFARSFGQNQILH